MKADIAAQQIRQIFEKLPNIDLKELMPVDIHTMLIRTKSLSVKRNLGDIMAPRWLKYEPSTHSHTYGFVLWDREGTNFDVMKASVYLGEKGFEAILLGDYVTRHFDIGSAVTSLKSIAR